jgi:hypothetical protein
VVSDSKEKDVVILEPKSLAALLSLTLGKLLASLAQDAITCQGLLRVCLIMPPTKANPV